MPWPSDIDPDDELAAVIAREEERQNTTIQLIASENFTSPAVLRAVGSVLTNKYSRGLPGQALLRRQPVHRRVGGPGHRPGAAAVRRRARQRAAPLRRQRQHGRLPGPAPAGRHHPGPVASTTAATSPTARRSTPAASCTTSSPTSCRPSDERIDLDQVRDLALSPPAQDDRCRCNRLPAPDRRGAVPRDRGRGRCAAHVRHRPHRRADRRWRAPEPGRHRRRRHPHHAQDAPRAARRRHPHHGRARRGSTRPSSPGSRAGRWSTSSRQGGGLPRGHAPVVQRPTPPRSWPTPRRWPRPSPGRASGWSPAAPTTT